jgi:hypothetical protein
MWRSFQLPLTGGIQRLYVYYLQAFYTIPCRKGVKIQAG